MNKKDLFSSSLITIAGSVILILFVPQTLPIEQGIIFLIIGIVVPLIQIFRQSTFAISKTFVIFGAIFIYLFIFQFFAKPVPISIVGIQRVLGFILMMLLVYTSLQNNNSRKIWENSLIIFAIFFSIISIYEVFRWYMHYYQVKINLQYIPMPQLAYRLKGFIFTHPNPLAGFMNLVWPIIAIRLINSKNFLHKLIWLVLLSLIGIVIVYTNSRGALLGTFFGGTILFVSWIFRNGFDLRVSEIFQSKKVKFSILAGLVIFSLLSITMIRRSILTGQFANRNLSGRGTIWGYSFQAFLESPIFGKGIGTFPISYARLAEFPPGPFPPSAHNLWLHFGVVYGIPGLLFAILLSFVFLFYILKAINDQKGGELSFKFAYISAVTALLVQHIVDYMFVTTNYLIFSIIIFVLLLKFTIPLGEWKLNRKSYLILIGSMLLLIGICQYSTTQQVISAAKHTDLANRYTSMEWELLEEKVCSISETHPENALYSYECSLAITNRLVNETNAAEKATLLNKAIEFQKRGFELNPYWVTQEANTAALYWKEGNRYQAISLMNHAVETAPTYDMLLMNLGWMEEVTGNETSALQHYTRALRINPLINISTFSEFSQLLSVAAEDLNLWIDSDELWEDWYGMDRHDRGPKDFAYWKGIIAISTGQNELAIRYFEDSINRDFKNAKIFVYMAYAYSLNGQPEIAELIVRDTTLLLEHELRNISDPADLVLFASILRDSGNYEDAYKYFLRAFEESTNEISYGPYYPMIYTQQFVGSDISPLLIRSHINLGKTQDDWQWFIEETRLRGDILLAQRVEEWQKNLAGIARMEISK